MLFDLSSPRRKTAVRIIFGGLAVLFAVGFIGFGIGGELGGGGIVDSITGGGDGDTAEQYEQQIEDAENRLEENPNDERALATLVQYRFLSGNAQLELDEETGQPIGVTEESRSEFEATIEAWTRYVDTDPQRVDVSAATNAVNAYRFLGDAGGGAEAALVLAKANPSANNYIQVAFFRYADGDIKGGDEAGDLALEEASQDQKKQAQQILDQYRKAAVKAKKNLEKSQDSESGGTGIESPFGGLGPDSGLPPTAP